MTDGVGQRVGVAIRPALVQQRAQLRQRAGFLFHEPGRLPDQGLRLHPNEVPTEWRGLQTAPEDRREQRAQGDTVACRHQVEGVAHDAEAHGAPMRDQIG